MSVFSRLLWQFYLVLILARFRGLMTLSLKNYKFWCFKFPDIHFLIRRSYFHWNINFLLNLVKGVRDMPESSRENASMGPDDNLKKWSWKSKGCPYATEF